MFIRILHYFKLNNSLTGRQKIIYVCDFSVRRNLAFSFKILPE